MKNRIGLVGRVAGLVLFLLLVRALSNPVISGSSCANIAGRWRFVSSLPGGSGTMNVDQEECQATGTIELHRGGLTLLKHLGKNTVFFFAGWPLT